MKNTLKIAFSVGITLSTLVTVSCSKDKVNVTPINQNPPVSQDTTIKLEIIGTSISETGATINSTIISEGGATITERGIVFSKSTNPTLTDTKLTNTGIGIGIFSTNISNLSPSTTYFVRAYATNSKGTAYSTQVSFTTSALATFISYKNDIAPILSLQCVGCHNNLNNHTGVSNWSSKALTEMKNGNMPPNGQLPTGFIEKFEDWITQGKKNN